MISIHRSLPAYRSYYINNSKLDSSVTKHLLKTYFSCCSHLSASMGEDSLGNWKAVTLELLWGLHYCTVLQAAPEKSLGHVCNMLHTSTRSHCKLGTAFKQMHSAGIRTNVGVWHGLATGLCPEFSECTQCSLSSQRQPCRMETDSAERLTPSLHTIFSSRFGDSMNTNAILCCGAEPALVFKVYWHGTCSGQTWQYCSSDVAGSESKVAVFSTEQESSKSQVVT